MHQSNHNPIDQSDADHTAKVLAASDLASDAPRDDVETARLGSSINAAIAQVLPEASEALRAAVLSKLNDDGQSTEVTMPSSSRFRPWVGWATVAACVGGLLFLLAPSINASRQASHVMNPNANSSVAPSSAVPPSTTITRMQIETRSRPIAVSKTRVESRVRQVERDGKMVTESYQVSVPYTETVDQSYTVQVPVTSAQSGRPSISESVTPGAAVNLNAKKPEAILLFADGNGANLAALDGEQPAALNRLFRHRDVTVLYEMGSVREYGLIGTEQYEASAENEFTNTDGLGALSTFSIDVDTASYANTRRFLTNGQLPPPSAVRVEEFLNYFTYEYPQPENDVPFAVHTEVASCPWNKKHKLLRVGLKGKEIQRDERPASNLVFLLDVSGSMQSPDKLALMKQGLKKLVKQLREDDMVSIVTYAGNAGVVLEPTSGNQSRKIIRVIESLDSGGSTHGSAGIDRAYELAAQNFIEEGTNRVIMATDGDLNVGITEDEALVELIKAKAGEGVFLTVLGFGTGNLKDAKMEKLADHGNGVYAYIDSVRESHKVLVHQMSGSLVTIAKDVKLQLEFNPKRVQSYRLIGYENRALANKDFDNDKKDAGEIGAGHTVTALYELIPVGSKRSKPPVDLKYQDNQVAAEEAVELNPAADSNDLVTLALRYKEPDAQKSKKIEFVCEDSKKKFAKASEDFRFAASVTAFGMILRQSKHAGGSTIEMCQEIAGDALGDDVQGYRSEFLDLVEIASEVIE